MRETVQGFSMIGNESWNRMTVWETVWRTVRETVLETVGEETVSETVAGKGHVREKGVHL